MATDTFGNTSLQGTPVPTTNLAPQTPAAPVTPASPVPVNPTDAQVQERRSANAGKPGFDAFGDPVSVDTSKNTYDSKGNFLSGTQTGADAVTTARNAAGTYQGGDGKTYYNYDNSPVTTNTATGGPTTFSADSNGVSAAQQKILADQQAQVAAAQQFSNTITGIQNGSIPLNSGQLAQISGLQSQFQTLIDSQNLANTTATGVANTRGYQSGAAEYDPTFQTKTIASLAAAGANKVADLQTKMASAVAQLTSSFQKDNIAAVKSAYDTLKTAQDDYDKGLQDYVTEVQKSIKDAQDAKVAADKVVYDTVTKPINDLKQVAKNNGAPDSVMAAIGSAQDLDSAYQAAGNYAAQGTGAVAEYNYAKANGYSGTFSQYQTEDANRKAAATAAASAALMPTEPAAGLGGDAGGGSILNATGLSIAAFNYLTQGTPSLSRLTASQRLQIMSEAQNYLNKTGTDISTFQSQYKAYNDVLQKNISRANQTQIMAGEVSGSADALMSAIDERDLAKADPFNPLGGGGLGSLRPQIIADLALGKQVNDPTALKYTTQLRFMANDLAGYLAASRGATSPELQDVNDAAQLISNGLSKGSVQAFKDSINSNEEKVATVVNKAVDSTRKQVWGLFGAAEKYKGGNSVPDSAAATSNEAKTKVNTYITSHPDQADAVSKLYTKNFTDDQVAEYLNL